MWIRLVTLAAALVTAAAAAAADEKVSNPASAAERRDVLIVLTNHGQLGETGKPTGFYLSEAAHPWHVFREAGYDVHFASPSGGAAPIDPRSLDLNDPVNAAFLEQVADDDAVPDTLAAGELDPADYAAIFYAGGHGTMWDLPASDALAEVTADIYDQGGVVAAVCHGPAGLVNVRLADGSYLVQDRRVAAFTNAEEQAVGLTDTMPFLLETMLRQRGARFVGAPNFQANVVVDDRLVTGQNPASARGAAEAVVKLLER